jgi:streptogramin lyase
MFAWSSGTGPAVARPLRGAIGIILVTVAIVAAGVGLPGTVRAATTHLYWSNYASGTIGRADADGTNVDHTFIAGADHPIGVAAAAGRLYWASEGTDAIGRARLDGTQVDQALVGGASDPGGVAAASGHVYWANYGTGTIGRARLDGTGVDQTFITGANHPIGVAVDGQHLYWMNNSTGTIGRADLDGTNVDQAFISGATAGTGVAVDAHHVYWVNQGSEAIGRADLDGTNVDQAFITGADTPGWTIAVDADHLYWTCWKGGRIDRADRDGTDVEKGFITGASNPLGVAVDATPPAPQPDGQISRTSAKRGFVGGDTYARVPIASQTRTHTADRTRRTYTFWVRVQNDGGRSDRFTVRATAKRTGGTTVAYLVGGKSRTAAIVAGTYRTSSKAPGGVTIVVIKVTVPAGVQGASAVVRLSARSVAAPTAIDVVRAIVKR